jgi:hypothetical protein
MVIEAFGIIGWARDTVKLSECRAAGAVGPDRTDSSDVRNTGAGWSEYEDGIHDG